LCWLTPGFLKSKAVSPGLLGNFLWLTPEFLKSKAVSPRLLRKLMGESLLSGKQK